MVWDMMKADPQEQKTSVAEATRRREEMKAIMKYEEVLMYRWSAESYPNAHFSLGVQVCPTSGFEVVSSLSSTGSIIEV